MEAEVLDRHIDRLYGLIWQRAASEFPPITPPEPVSNIGAASTGNSS
jgi:hypothetical protein